MASDVELDRHIELLQRLPQETRAYSHDVERARVEFGVSGELFEKLIARSLPHANVDGDTRVDWRDLHYLSLRLSLPSAHSKALQAWARTFRQIAADAAATARVRYFCPRADGEQPVRALVPGRAVEALVTPGRPVADFVSKPTSPGPAVDGAAAAIVQDVARSRFYLLPPALSGDTQLARTTGFSDCLTAAQLVVAGCTEVGIEAREAFGLLLSTPLSTPHSWAEICVADGSWVAVDALLVGLLERFGDCTWPLSRGIDRFVVRLADRPTAIVSAAGVETSTLLVTDLIRGTDARPA